MTPEVFQAALARGDIDTAGEMLADNVVFRSPAVFEPYEGKPATMVLLKAVSRVFQDFRYRRTFIEENGRGLVMLFEAKVGNRACEVEHEPGHRELIDALAAHRSEAGDPVPEEVAMTQ